MRTFDLFLYDLRVPSDAAAGFAGADWKLWLNMQAHAMASHSAVCSLWWMRFARPAAHLSSPRDSGALTNIGGNLLGDSNVIYAARESFAASNATGEWDEAFGFLASRVPVMVIDLAAPERHTVVCGRIGDSAAQLATRFEGDP